MSEKPAEDVQELFKKIEEFEKTIMGLLDNIKKFKAKLLENTEKYGSDPTKWPKSAGGAE